ncbi:MAG: hypothetical protein J7M03_02570, partial [Candidatus Desulfofervidaceae bacterium]|nr:hypothetical protein [Candidatus Desulfofervidaceae bacterium]
KGSVTFKVSKAKLSLEASSIFFPLSFFHTIQGLIEFSPDIIRILSLTAEGQEIYAKLKGEIVNNKAHLNLEMQTASALSRPYFALLKKYEIMPGYYKIPFDGILTTP